MKTLVFFSALLALSAATPLLDEWFTANEDGSGIKETPEPPTAKPKPPTAAPPPGKPPRLSEIFKAIRKLVKKLKAKLDGGEDKDEVYKFGVNEYKKIITPVFVYAGMKMKGKIMRQLTRFHFQMKMLHNRMLFKLMTECFENGLDEFALRILEEFKKQKEAGEKKGKSADENLNL